MPFYVLYSKDWEDEIWENLAQIPLLPLCILCATVAHFMNTTPTRDEILTRIQLLVAKLLNLSIDRIQPETRLQEDLGCDSVFMIHFTLTLEDEFNVDLDATNTVYFATINSITDYVMSQSSAK